MLKDSLLRTIKRNIFVSPYISINHIAFFFLFNGYPSILQKEQKRQSEKREELECLESWPLSLHVIKRCQSTKSCLPPTKWVPNK